MKNRTMRERQFWGNKKEEQKKRWRGEMKSKGYTDKVLKQSTGVLDWRDQRVCLRMEI